MFTCRDIIPGIAELVGSTVSQQTRCSEVCYELTLSSVLTEAISFLLNTVQSNESSYGLAKLHYTVTQGSSPCPCCGYRNVQSSK